MVSMAFATDHDDTLSKLETAQNNTPAYRDGRTGLPAEKSFPIQIGSKLYRLSGLSIMSDAPSYFSKFFEEQLQKNEAGGIRTLYVDRDPATFEDIALHLQGYHVAPSNGGHYVKLFADAHFYSLPRLIAQLYTADIPIQIGATHFSIPRTLFTSPGDSPNYFTLGFSAFFSTPTDPFPGLAHNELIRPPTMQPPVVAERSGAVFADLLHMLGGYELHVRDAEHRAALLRDCRFYNFRGLEQRLIPCATGFDSLRGVREIVVRLQDLRQSGVGVAGPAGEQRVTYARPFVEERAAQLIVDVDEESMRVELRWGWGVPFGRTYERLTSLFAVVAGALKLPEGTLLAPMMWKTNDPLGFRHDRVRVEVTDEAHVVLDGEEYVVEKGDGELERGDGHEVSAKKRKRDGGRAGLGEWVIKRGQWRLKLRALAERDRTQGMEGQLMEIVMQAVKLEAVSGSRGRNMLRGFLE